MKIIRKDCVYVQLEDINYLANRKISMPKRVIHRALENGYLYVDETNKYTFIRYDENEIIEFFKDLSVVIDYDSIKNLPSDQLEQYCDNILKAKDEKLDKFNNLPKEKRMKREYDIEEINDLEYKYYQVHKFLLYKEGYDTMTLPKEIEKENKKGGLKNIFKRIIGE